MLKKLAKSTILRGLTRRFDSVFSTTRIYGDIKAAEVIADGVLRLATERGFSDAQRYELFYLIGRKLQPDFPINDRGRYLLADAEFRREFETFLGSGNWKNFERRWNLEQMLRLVASVPGNLAECGVFEGASARQLCRFASEHGRRVDLFDSVPGIERAAAE